MVWLLLCLKIRWLCLVSLLWRLVTRVWISKRRLYRSVGVRGGLVALDFPGKIESLLDGLLFAFAFLVVSYLGSIQLLGLGSGFGSDLGRALAHLHVGAHISILEEF